MKKKYLLFFIVILLLLTTSCRNRNPKEENSDEASSQVESEEKDENSSSGEESEKESFFVGDKYKNIILDDNSGNNERLSDYLGKPILLSFWTSWSAESEKFNRLVKESYSEFEDDIHVISINVTAIEGHNLEYIIKYIQSEGYPFPVFFDLDGQITKGYLIRSFPTGFIINKEGIIEQIFIGNVEKDDFLYEIEKAITGQNE